METTQESDDEITTIRIKKKDLQKLEEARNALVHKGIGKLPPTDLISSEIKRAETEKFTNGFLVGLASVALLYLISKS
jgi:hypothetical protein